jgi:hypothetical protein
LLNSCLFYRRRRFFTPALHEKINPAYRSQPLSYFALYFLSEMRYEWKNCSGIPV